MRKMIIGVIAVAMLAVPTVALAGTASDVGKSRTLTGMSEKMRVTVLAVRDNPRSSNQFITPDAGKRYFAIKVRMTNVGNVLYSDSPSNGASVIDTRNQEWDASFMDAVEPALGSPKIRRGSTRDGWLTFEVPKTAKLKEFQLSLNSGFSDDVGVWRLR